MKTVTNHYEHCSEEWELSECDSFHNDRCPSCDQEITPVVSIVYDEGGDMVLIEDHRK